MYLAKVEGTAVSTIKHKSLKGHKLLIARRCEPDGTMASEPVVILDTVSAGTGDLVMVSTDGDLIRKITGFNTAPARLTAVGIIDSYPKEKH
jgi:microcompartment protein CcmK/EutM